MSGASSLERVVSVPGLRDADAARAHGDVAPDERILYSTGGRMQPERR
jgi:hypothetical protein